MNYQTLWYLISLITCTVRTLSCMYDFVRGHEEAVLCVQFNERKIVSGSADRTIKVLTGNIICSKKLLVTV